MIDVHCHLNFNYFEKDYDEVIKNAFEDGITKIINVGTKIDSSKKAVEFSEKYENLYAIIGVHPHHADKLEENNIICSKTALPTDSQHDATKNPSGIRLGSQELTRWGMK